eukprot:CAMPEP_0172496166 /NCGR_PEP_ID=MMETSP1066-20121228/82519_1 /TAXON_ID=671091 /ORGANISM="Coscinodiscus wailesii, Strain CCMP2513" /LENGTH=92 /DNA_ID=CAMNT_0013268307 /DNA_START=241 /DNA_END=515 /DNA_ORIENTATION=+
MTGLGVGKNGMVHDNGTWREGCAAGGSTVYHPRGEGVDGTREEKEGGGGESEEECGDGGGALSGNVVAVAAATAQSSRSAVMHPRKTMRERN